MKLIGKIDDLPVYEFDEGQYVIVNPESERWMVTWVWYGNLGKNFDTFVKCQECEEDDKCIEIIEKNKEDILDRLNDAFENSRSENGKEFLKEQKEFYDSLEEGREYDWYSGYLDEEEEQSAE